MLKNFNSSGMVSAFIKVKVDSKEFSDLAMKTKLESSTKENGARSKEEHTNVWGHQRTNLPPNTFLLLSFLPNRRLRFARKTYIFVRKIQ